MEFMHAPVLVAPAAATPVSADEAKTHLKVETGDEDALIEGLVAGATQHLDGYAGVLGRCMVTQSWRQDFDDFARILRLPMPAAGITGISWVDEAGAASSIDAANYELQADALGSFVRFVDDYDFPGDLAQTRAVRVTYTAGYGDAAAVPAPLKVAILLLVGHWYAHRRAVSDAAMVELPLGVAMMIAPYRRVGV